MTTIPAVLVGLDFTPVLGCEHDQHGTHHEPGDPAAVFVRARCPECAVSTDFTLCLSGWRDLMVRELHCLACGASDLSHEDTFEVLQYISWRRP